MKRERQRGEAGAGRGFMKGGGGGTPGPGVAGRWPCTSTECNAKQCDTPATPGEQAMWADDRFWATGM